MVRRNETHKIMERLESIGASAVIETDISNCRL
jgi:ATP phosphoribosyltransferase